MYTLHMCLKAFGTEMAASHDLDLHYIVLNHAVQNHFYSIKNVSFALTELGVQAISVRSMHKKPSLRVTVFVNMG